MSNIKKRFIAGAVCPRCSSLDKLVMYKQEGKEYRECVSCGFQDEMRFQQHPRELQTRVNVTEAQKQADTQVLVLDPKGNKQQH